jgi:hypothetical protein
MTLLLRRVFVGLWLVALSAAVLALNWGQAESKPKVATFDTINAKRINIVEPDGKYRLVIANTEHYPGNFMKGKEYERPGGHRSGGLLFFNDEGDEVGGLSFGSHTSANGYSASSGLLFDQYRQDQTVGIIYRDHNGHRVAGLQVWDRPDYSIQPLMEMNDRAAKAKTEKQRKAIRKKMLAYAKAHGGVGAKRMFVGKQSEDAIVRLADKEGHPRLVLKVDSQGRPTIEFLDKHGNVVRRISGGVKAGSS